MHRSDLCDRARRLLRLPPSVVLTTVRAGFVLIAVELLIRSLSLPRLSRLLGVRINLQPIVAEAVPLSVDDLPVAAQRQLWCTAKVADAWPFSQGPCLRRALVGGHLIRRLNPSVRLGVAGTGEMLRAHAWLEIDDCPLEPVSEFTPFQSNSVVAR